MNINVSPSRALVFTLAAASLTLAAGCSDEGSSGTSSPSSSEGGAGGGAESGSLNTKPVMISFEGRVGGEVFSCGATYPGLGTSGANVKLTDYRLYLHDVRLHNTTTGEDVPLSLTQDDLFQYKNVALLDFEDKTAGCENGTAETNAMIMAHVPEGDYNGVSFKLGVPFELNHADASTAPSPLNLTALFWSWTGGYKFLRADSVSGADSTPFNLHIGSSGCVPGVGGVTSCDRPNVADVVLPSFDPEKNKVVVDYAAVVAASDLTKNEGGGPGCMSGAMDPECGPIFERVGLNYNDGSVHPETQTLFRVE